MGVSTVASYTGAQIFEAIGLGHELVEEYFTGTVSRLGGIGLDEIAAEVAVRHALAHPANPAEAGAPQARARRRVPVAPRGRVPPVQPRDRLQAAARDAGEALRHLQGVHEPGDDQSTHLATLRGLFQLKRASGLPSRVDEVEPVSEIVKRFSTGAMSYGSISAEAHETLAIAMNSIGGKSRTPARVARTAIAARPDAAQLDQAGRLRTLRRHERVPVQRRRHPDQDGPGRQARRGRPAARPQGVPVGGQDPSLDARASGSSARRRTTTSTRSRISSS